MKVVINSRSGGFGLSPEALLWLWTHGLEKVGMEADQVFNPGELVKKLDRWQTYQRTTTADQKGWIQLDVFTPDEKTHLSHHNLGDKDRTDPILIQCIEEMGDKVNGDYSHLKIVEVPDDVNWTIQEGETGAEWVAEVHRVWH